MNPERASLPQGGAPPPAAKRPRSISLARDTRQSRFVVAAVAGGLLVAALHAGVVAVRAHRAEIWAPLLLSIAFAATVLLLRAATPAAALLGLLVCFFLASPSTRALAAGARLFHVSLPGTAALVVLFVLTFLSTRFRRARKERAGLGEPRRGRQASQIAANLGAAGVFAAVGLYPCALAALAEATADTVSSEIGQALGGPTWMITTLRRTAPGTDGGVSLPGTLAGLSGALLVILAGRPSGGSLKFIGLEWIAAGAGLAADSVLGATLERRGWIGNDLVNFSSTVVAAAVALLLLAI